MANFADLGLSAAALTAVEKMGYTEPTPVQAQTIPLVLDGRDVVAAASTGTGKTAAFLLPTMSRLKRAKKGGGPRMLVVSPTRELASQIGDACFQICRETGHFISTVYGGTKYGPQIKKLKRGVDILIATPGRLNDLRDRGVVSLADIDVLVLDEADRMLDMGFWPAMQSIIAETPNTRQTLMFSATIDGKIMNSVGTILKTPALVEIAQRGSTAETVEQYVMPIAQNRKTDLLQAVLTEKGSERIIVFARTKYRTEECMESLRHAGYRAESIHSDKSQFQRKRALENFSKGKTSILVATDVLARGIDVSGVDHVINFDLPDCPEDYVHRIGRTGRAGEEGYAISFVSRETRGALLDIERLIGKKIPSMDLEGFELDPSLLTKPMRGKSGGAKRQGGGSRFAGSGRGNSGNGGSAGGARSGGYPKKSYGAPKEGSRSGAPSNRDGAGREDRAKRPGCGSSRPYADKGAAGRPQRDGGRSAEFAGKRSNGKSNAYGEKNGQNRSSSSKPRQGEGKGYDYSKFAKNDKIKATDRD